MNIAALVSGGVDSSVVIHQLKEAGEDPVLFYIRIAMEGQEGMDCSAEEDIEITSYLARKYGCRFEVVSLHDEYWENVMTYALDAVRRGLTPNPDMMCNKMIKFGYFNQRWGSGFDKIATGHYATTTEQNGKVYLSTAADYHKDQTYFLGQIDSMQVSKLMFPIGNLLKPEVRSIAAATMMPNARRRDSQGICFLGKINYNDFIRRHLGEKPGKIIELESGKLVGTHRGYWFHTIGQRKGLGLSGGPWFVVAKNVDENILYVSKGYDTPQQYGRDVLLDSFHFITDNPWADRGATEITFKTRHTPEFSRGTIESSGSGYIIRATEPIQGIAPGQFGVVYDRASHICIGSGVISAKI